MSKEYKFHEVADIFPLDEEGLDMLTDDISKYGQQNAIELLNDLILDGRRRYLACAKAGITPRFMEMDIEDPVDYVLSINLHRRHLTLGQRAIVAVKAAKLKEKYASEAKDRMISGKGHDGSGGRGHKRNPMENLPQGLDTGKTRDKLGQKFGVSGRSVDSASRVLDRGSTALKDAATTGLIAVSTAEKITKLPKEHQDVLVERVKQARAEGKRAKVRTELDNRKESEFEFDADLKGVGVIRAHEAINSLKRIPKDDPLKIRGFQIVTDWIKHNK